VSFFHARLHLREDLSKILADVKDVARTLQKLVLGRGDPSDLLSIRETICVWDSIKQHIELEREMELRERGNISQDEWASIDTLISRMSDLRSLTNRIGSALSGDQGEDSSSPAIGTNVENSSADFPESSRITWRYGQDKWVLKPE
jgi:DNA mismatch repair ATPase MutS